MAGATRSVEDAKTPKLSPATLGFADAVGTGARSRRVDRAEPFLAVLVEALERGQAILHGAEYAHGVRSNWFSDSLCLSVPGEDRRALETVVESMATVAATFALLGVFLRGAVTVDLHYQRGSVTFGPGLTKLAEAERGQVNFPRVLLLDPAEKLARDHLATTKMPLALDEIDGRVFVDFIQYLDEDLDEFGDRIAAAVGEARELSHRSERDRALELLGWLEEYFEDGTGLSPHTMRPVRRPPERFHTLTGHA